jgi:tryptophanyl-tRNA synthetase
VKAIPGIDGRKMSKSYDNTIPLFASSTELRKLIFRIKTDSSAPGEPKDPEESSIFKIFREIAPAERTNELAERFRRGIGWADAKQALFDALERFLIEPRKRYAELMSNSAMVDEILKNGADKARRAGRPVLEEVRRAVGIA